MSTFNGIIKEYPLISIDYFMPYSNFKSTVFFLSHCHTDHMIGLGSKKFFDLLEKRCFSHIYVSEVSQHLLKNDYYYSKLKNYIISLPLEEPQVIVVPDENGGFHSKVVVTLLPAGHCLGSVMFLIEGHNGRVLYTGDFRLPIGGSARLTKLHDENGHLKPLDSLYIDTTFCQRKYLHFPPRENCLSSMFNLIEQWLKKGPNYIIAFSCPAKYNYEFLFVELFEKFKVKIHISEDKLRKYKGIKCIEDAVTTVPTDTQIHACFYPEPEKALKDVHIDDEPCDHDERKPCVRITETSCGFHTPDRRYLKLLIIRPCAKSFSNCDDNEDLLYYNKKDKVHRICFSTHSSLAEVRDMVLYLKPKYIYPNVVENQTEEDILDLIFEKAPPIEDSSDLSQAPLGILKNLQKDDSYSVPDSLPFFDECYQIPPPNLLVNAAAKPKAQRVEQILSSGDSSDESEAVEVTVFENESVKKDSQVPKHENANVLKWNCPLFSNDENLDPNSSFSSSQDMFEINSTPGNSEDQTPDLFSSPESKTVMKSSSPKNAADLFHSSFKEETGKNNSMLFSENYSADIETSPSSESKVILDQNVKVENIDDHTIPKSNHVQSERILYNPLELLFSETSSNVTPSDLNNPRDISTPCGTKDFIIKDQIVNQQPSEEKPSISNTFHVESNIEEKPEISFGSSTCKSWRLSKLIDNNECINPYSMQSSLEERGSKNQTMQVIGKPKQRDSDSEYQSSLEDLIYFSKLINEATEQEQNKTSDNFKKSASKHLVRAKGEGIPINTVSKESLLNSNLTEASEVPCSVKPIHQNAQLKQKPDFLNEQTKDVKGFNTCTINNNPPNNISPNSIYPKGQVSKFNDPFSAPSFTQPKNIQQYQTYLKPNPLKDISTSKYEKSLLKVKKKSSKKVQNDDSDDIVILNILQTKPSSIEVIDLSSDDSFEEQCVIENTSNLSKEKPDSRYIPNFKDKNELESLSLSPSLLTAKYIPKESSEKFFINSLGNKTTKRKSDENEYMFIKSLRTGTSVDHNHCYEDACFDSTPEDLLIHKA